MSPRSFGAQFAPILDSRIAAAKPGQCDEINLLIFIERIDEAADFGRYRISSMVLEDGYHEVIRRIRRIPRVCHRILDIEFTGLDDEKAHFVGRDRKAWGVVWHR